MFWYHATVSRLKEKSKTGLETESLMRARHQV
jgi:hypothetical protein